MKIEPGLIFTSNLGTKYEIKDYVWLIKCVELNKGATHGAVLGGTAWKGTDELLKMIKETTTMSNVKSIIRKITRTEPEKTFVKIGFMDENEEITQDGRSALEYLLWEANKDGLKKLADSISTEDGK